MAKKDTPPMLSNAQNIEADREKARGVLDGATAAIDEADKLIDQLPKTRQKDAKESIDDARNTHLPKITAEIDKIDTAWKSALSDPDDGGFVVDARQSLDTIRDTFRTIDSSLEVIRAVAAKKSANGGGSTRRTSAEIEDANKNLLDAAAIDVVAIKEHSGDVKELEVKAKKIAKTSGVREARAAFSRLKAKADEVKKIPQDASSLLAKMRVDNTSAETPVSRNKKLEADAAKIKRLLSVAEIGKREVAVLNKEVQTEAENGEAVWYLKLFGRLLANEMPWMIGYAATWLLALGVLLWALTQSNIGMPYVGVGLWIGFVVATFVAALSGSLRGMMCVNVTIAGICLFLAWLGPSQGVGSDKKDGSSNSATIVYEVITSNPASLDQGSNTLSTIVDLGVVVIAIVVLAASVAAIIHFVKRSRNTTPTTP